MTFTPILATTSHYVLHSPPQGVVLPVDPALVNPGASEAASDGRAVKESLAPNNPQVAQLDKAGSFYFSDCRFESCPADQSLATQRQTLIAAYARCKKRGDRAGAKAVWEKLHKVTNQMLGAV